MHRSTIYLPLPLVLACADPQPGTPAADDPADEQDTTASSTTADDGPAIICEPDQQRCGDDPGTLEVCAPTGLAWEPVACGKYQVCEPCGREREGECEAACVGPCERLEGTLSSAGCSFRAIAVTGTELLVVSNPDPARTATVGVRRVPEGSNKEQDDGDPVEIGPGESHGFEIERTIDPSLFWTQESDFRSGGFVRVVADLPVSMQHYVSKVNGVLFSSVHLGLPDHSLGHDYVVYNHGRGYFSIIALEDQTTVRWQPTAATVGDNLPLPFVEVGETGEQLVNRNDAIRIVPSKEANPTVCSTDLSGTLVSADKPIWLTSAVKSTVIPLCSSPGCEHDLYGEHACPGFTGDGASEQPLPIAAWGTEYVGPHPPDRGGDDIQIWRIFAGDDDVTVTITPESVSPPIELGERGDWVELVVAADLDLHFVGDGRFMPVQYTTGYFAALVQDGGPAMLQMIPTSAYADRYTFELQPESNPNREQRQVIAIIRPNSDVEVTLDDVVIDADAWKPVDGWEVAHLEVDTHAHVLAGAAPVGVVAYFYSFEPWFDGLDGDGHGLALGFADARTVAP